jgi:hypothetical protein
MNLIPRANLSPEDGRRPNLWRLLVLLFGARLVAALCVGRSRRRGQAQTSDSAQTYDSAQASNLAQTSNSEQASNPVQTSDFAPRALIAEVWSPEQTGALARDTPWADDPWTRVAVDCLLLALAPAAVLVSVVDADGVARLLLVLAAACLVPGGALLTRLATDDLLSAFGLAVGLSLCIETVGALVMIWTGWWHPLGFSLALMALACAALVLDLRRNLATLSRGAR